MRALVVGRDLERAARAGRVLLEDQRDLLAGEPPVLAALSLGGLELGGEIEQVRRAPRRRSRRASGSCVRGGRWWCHGVPLLRTAGSRRIGQDMQRGPPRPRPSSKPAMVMTSMPLRRRQRVGGDVALVGDDDAGGEGEHVVAVVPLLALGLVAVAAGLEQPQVRDVERGGDARRTASTRARRTAPSRAGPRARRPSRPARTSG